MMHEYPVRRIGKQMVIGGIRLQHDGNSRPLIITSVTIDGLAQLRQRPLHLFVYRIPQYAPERVVRLPCTALQLIVLPPDIQSNKESLFLQRIVEIVEWVHGVDIRQRLDGERRLGHPVRGIDDREAPSSPGNE